MLGFALSSTSDVKSTVALYYCIIVPEVILRLLICHIFMDRIIQAPEPRNESKRALAVYLAMSMREAPRPSHDLEFKIRFLDDIRKGLLKANI